MNGARYLIHDRDPLFAEQFREILKCYDSAILAKVDIPSNGPPRSGEEKPSAEYMNVVREAKNTLREIFNLATTVYDMLEKSYRTERISSR